MPNLGGPKQERRRLLMKVVTSIAIYAAPIWAGAMDKRSYRTGMDAAYTRSALRVISAFRTVSTDAAVVIAGMMPLRLIVDIERRKHDSRRGTDLPKPVQIEDDAMDKWQQDWANSNKGQFQQVHTEHRRMDQEKTRPGEHLPDTVVNGPWML